MTGFFAGNLQDGIALAVREAKAVVCFVRDDTRTSSTWEEEYLADDKIAQTLSNEAVLLRITAGTQEAGFLTSFCPIARVPAVVVIKNGKLQQYLVPEISKIDFQTQILSAVTGLKSPETPQETQTSATIRDGGSATISIPNNTSTHSDRTVRPPVQQKPKTDYGSGGASKRNLNAQTNSRPGVALSKGIPGHQPTAKQEQTGQVQAKSNPCISSEDHGSISAGMKQNPSAPSGPPSQYRLQVRLFDGSSVRSSFAPTQTISSDVRPWLDHQMGTEQKPYSLKHILNPLPSCTISVSEETLTLEELGLGSTANLVMVPVASYIDAYSTAGSSLPIRGMMAAYNVVSSAASRVVGYGGSLIGYDLTGSTASGTGSPAPEPGPLYPGSTGAQGARVHKPVIRTLRDRESDDNDSQLYNGNQLNFEPRKGDGKHD